MLVYPDGSDRPLRGDLVEKIILRTDLTPVPASVELVVRRGAETVAITEGKSIRLAGVDAEFQIVKVVDQEGGGAIQGDRLYTSKHATALLKSCAPIATPLQRSVIREAASLGGIYRACGAQVRIGSDFTVPVFAAFSGMTPSFEVAKVLQEEAGVLVFNAGQVTFRRLRELLESAPAITMTQDVSEAVESGFLEQHAIPRAISTVPSGAFVSGSKTTARGFFYRPRADQRIVNNLSVALVLRKKLKNAMNVAYNAGARVDIAGVKYIVITAAHVFESKDSGSQYTQFWLGEVSK